MSPTAPARRRLCYKKLGIDKRYKPTWAIFLPTPAMTRLLGRTVNSFRAFVISITPNQLGGRNEPIFKPKWLKKS